MCAPSAGAEADRNAGVDPLATGRVDARIDGDTGYGHMFDLPPMDVDDALLNQVGALGGLCYGGEMGRDSARMPGARSRAANGRARS
jgi:hypothetical protein